MKKMSFFKIFIIFELSNLNGNNSELPLCREEQTTVCCPRTRAVVAKSVLAPLARALFFMGSGSTLSALLPGASVTIITSDRAAEAICELTNKAPAVLTVPLYVGLTAGSYFIDKEVEATCNTSTGCSNMFANATIRTLYNATERANKGSIFSKFGKWLTGKMTPKRCQHTKPAPLLTVRASTPREILLENLKRKHNASDMATIPLLTIQPQSSAAAASSSDASTRQEMLEQPLLRED